jgi:hypothetical protein
VIMKSGGVAVINEVRRWWWEQWKQH